MIRGVLTGVGTLLCAFLVAPGMAGGAEPADLGLTPMSQPGAYFEFSLAAGERQTAEVEAANFGDEAADARTYAADVYSVVNGGFGAELYGEGPGAVTRWISYPTQQLRLGPRQAERVPFAITVPAGTLPGEYIAALVIESTAPLRSTGLLALSQVHRSAIAIAITVPGPRQPALVINAVTHRTVAGRSILAYEVDNPGNVHLWPAGTYGLLTADGSPVQAGSVAMDSVYGRGATLLEVPLREPLAPGSYCARLSLTDAASGAHDETDCLALAVPGAGAAVPVDEGPGQGLPETSLLGPAPPPVILGLGFALVVGACLILVRRRMRRRRAASIGVRAHA